MAKPASAPKPTLRATRAVIPGPGIAAATPKANTYANRSVEEIISLRGNGDQHADFQITQLTAQIHHYRATGDVCKNVYAVESGIYLNNHG